MLTAAIVTAVKAERGTSDRVNGDGNAPLKRLRQRPVGRSTRDWLTARGLAAERAERGRASWHRPFTVFQEG